MGIRNASKNRVQKIVSLLFRRRERVRPRASGPLQREEADDSLFEGKISLFNEAAEKYFVGRRPYFVHDARKPFFPDPSSPRLIARIGSLLTELVYDEHLIVLDFGCGLGWLSQILNWMAFNVVGLDVSPTAVRFAAEILPRSQFHLADHFHHFLDYDGRTFPLSDSSVHFVISHDAFHHVPNQAAVLKEMHRVLVPGGRLILSEPGTGHVKAKTTAEEVARHGVLERDLAIPDFEEKALAAGFEEVFLKPCLAETDETWPRRQYREFFRGTVDPNFYAGLRQAMIGNPLFVCRKAGDLTSSFYHRAEINVGRDRLAAAPGETIRVPLELKNTGALTFSARRLSAVGFVTVSGRIVDADDRVRPEDQARLFLPRDILAGESAALEFPLRAPSQAGEYRVRFEPVYETFYWFSEKGTRPAVVPLAVRG